MLNITNAQAHEFFVDHWSVYRKVVDGDYMFHREIYAEVEQRLAATPGPPPRLLDLGCGDAGQIAPRLARLNLSGYVGVDLSAVALEWAARNLAPLGCPVELHEAEMLDWLGRETGEYGAIFSSFALHHLQTAEKQAFLRRCQKRLLPGGRMLLVDVMRDDDQDLPAYLEAYCSLMERDWQGLNRQELDFIIDHVRGNDVPEPVADTLRMALAAGFTRAESILQRTFHHLLCLETAA